MSRTSYFWHIGRGREPEFIQRGFKKRHVFPHRSYYLPKCGPDGFKLATWMCGPCAVGQLWEIVLYADDSVVAEFPRELFFDPDIVWHQQQFGRPGQVATADVVIAGKTLYSMAHLSDVFQRISRRREHKTRIETKLRGWSHMLMNSIVNFACERGLTAVRTPTAELALRHTDPARQVKADIFERIYDLTVQRLYSCRQDSKWWVISLDENRDRLVRPERQSESMPDPKTICICHDIERGLGHRTVDPSFARVADETAPGHLAAMLMMEATSQVKATYNVVGSIVPEVRASIEEFGHSLGFHSFDHDIRKAGWGVRWRDTLLGRKSDTGNDQLPRCRQVDYRIKGYRPPQSAMTSELSDDNLCFHNFEWLASSVSALGITGPELLNRVVRIPIVMDDFDLHRNHPYERWEARVMEKVERWHFAAISLHDCYGDLWLPHYERLLEKMSKLGEFRTLDEVAGAVSLGNSQ